MSAVVIPFPLARVAPPAAATEPEGGRILALVDANGRLRKAMKGRVPWWSRHLQKRRDELHDALQAMLAILTDERMAELRPKDRSRGFKTCEQATAKLAKLYAVQIDAEQERIRFRAARRNGATQAAAWRIAKAGEPRRTKAG